MEDVHANYAINPDEHSNQVNDLRAIVDASGISLDSETFGKLQLIHANFRAIQYDLIDKFLGNDDASNPMTTYPTSMQKAIHTWSSDARALLGDENYIAIFGDFDIIDPEIFLNLWLEPDRNELSRTVLTALGHPLDESVMDALFAIQKDLWKGDAAIWDIFDRKEITQEEAVNRSVVNSDDAMEKCRQLLGEEAYHKMFCEYSCPNAINKFYERTT